MANASVSSSGGEDPTVSTAHFRATTRVRAVTKALTLVAVETTDARRLVTVGDEFVLHLDETSRLGIVQDVCFVPHRDDGLVGEIDVGERDVETSLEGVGE